MPNGNNDIQTAFTNLSCDSVLKNGIIVTDYVRYDEQYRKYFYDYLSHTTFTSQQDVTSAGLSGFIPVDGIDIGIGANFDQNRYDTWKSDYIRETQNITTIDVAYEHLLQHADPKIVDAWLRCKTLEQASREDGLFLLLEPLETNSKQVKLTAFYVPHNTRNDPDATIVSPVKILGGQLDPKYKDAFKKGTKIYDYNSGGIVAIINRDDKPSSLFVSLVTNRGTLRPDRTASLPAPATPKILSFKAAENDYLDSDTIHLSWVVQGATNVFLDGRPVDTNGTEGIIANGNETFTLTAKGGFGTDESTLSISSKPNPMDEWKRRIKNSDHFFVVLDGPACHVDVDLDPNATVVCGAEYEMWFLPNGSVDQPGSNVWAATGTYKAFGAIAGRHQDVGRGRSIDENIINLWDGILRLDARGQLWDTNNALMGHFRMQ